MGIFSAEPTEKVAKKLLKEFEDVEGLWDVVKGIFELENSGVYEKMVYLRFKDIIDPQVKLKPNKEFSELEKLAREGLSSFPLRLPMTPLITVKDFLVVYTFIGYIYYIHINHKLNRDDLDKITYGPMANKILFTQEKFDITIETPHPTLKFFKTLGKVKWKNKKTKNFFNDISNFHFILAFNKWGGSKVSLDFPATEKGFIGLLSACSAVSDGRESIDISDVIRSEKTYLKLIRTDLIRLM